MKKHRFDLEKNKKLLKYFMPNYFEYITFMVSLVLYALATDLNLKTLQDITANICLMIMFYLVCWVIWACVLLFIKKRNDKKALISKATEVDQNNEN